MNNIPKNIWSTLVGVFALLIVFLVAVSIKEFKTIGYVGKSEQVVNTISVTGKGEIVTKPDVATFSFTVTETGKTVADAQAQATAKIDSALKAVKSGGVEEKDIKTTSYTINPHYEYQDGVCTPGGICRPGKNIPTGYDVSESIEVKVRDLTKAGALFGSIGTAGVQNVSGLSFSIDDNDAMKAKARDIAITNAKAKAQALADQLGVSLIRITGYYDNSEQPPFYNVGMGGDMMSAKAMSAPMAAPSIPAGEQKVTSSVSVTYEIK